MVQFWFFHMSLLCITVLLFVTGFKWAGISKGKHWRYLFLCSEKQLSKVWIKVTLVGVVGFCCHYHVSSFMKAHKSSFYSPTMMSQISFESWRGLTTCKGISDYSTLLISIVCIFERKMDSVIFCHAIYLSYVNVSVDIVIFTLCRQRRPAFSLSVHGSCRLSAAAPGERRGQQPVKGSFTRLMDGRRLLN